MVLVLAVMPVYVVASSFFFFFFFFIICKTTTTATEQNDVLKGITLPAFRVVSAMQS